MTKVIFDMPFEEYLAIEALSSSAIKTINVSISDFIEEKKENTSTPAKDLGRAYHKSILEGFEAFNAAYTVALNKDDYLCTVDDLKEFLQECGCASKGKNKSDYENLARELGGAIYSDAIAQEKREILTRDQYDRLNIYSNYFDGKFDDYQKEVTVLFEMNGVSCKARFDAVNSKYGCILDLKTFTNPRKKMLDVLPAQIISQYRYDIQAVFYAQAYQAAHKAGFFTQEFEDFKFLWVQTQVGYNVMETILKPDSEETYGSNAYWSKALHEIEQSAANFKEYLKIKDSKQKINFVPFNYLEDHHLPSYHFS